MESENQIDLSCYKDVLEDPNAFLEIKTDESLIYIVADDSATLEKLDLILRKYLLDDDAKAVDNAFPNISDYDTLEHEGKEAELQTDSSEMKDSENHGGKREFCEKPVTRLWCGWNKNASDELEENFPVLTKNPLSFLEGHDNTMDIIHQVINDNYPVLDNNDSWANDYDTNLLPYGDPMENPIVTKVIEKTVQPSMMPVMNQYESDVQDPGQKLVLFEIPFDGHGYRQTIKVHMKNLAACLVAQPPQHVMLTSLPKVLSSSSSRFVTESSNSSEKRGRKKRNRNEMRSEAEDSALGHTLLKKKRNNYASALYRDGKAETLADKKRSFEVDKDKNKILSEKLRKTEQNIEELLTIIASFGNRLRQ